jgi:hypothetical protein
MVIVPPWLIALLKLLCQGSGNLPAPWNYLAGLLCGLLPPGMKGPCKGCK